MHDFERSAPRLVKNTIQEGIELAAYAFILYGSLLYLWEHKAKGAQVAQGVEAS